MPTPLTDSEDEKRAENIRNDEEDAFVSASTNRISPPDVAAYRKQTSQVAERVLLKLRCNRNPIVGDKFSSRHGQKGILSRLWPHEDMPFTESGLVPDILFNPHGFPSRMTIGMLIESVAGKVAAIHGTPKQDGTPFRRFPKVRMNKPWLDNGGMRGLLTDKAKPIMKAVEGFFIRPGKMGGQKRPGVPLDEEDKGDEWDDSIDYFGKALTQAGFEYYGTEPMYSGLFGGLMEADIFIGIVYYQRLRHMVSDKAQVRATGPVDMNTRQPVKGRKRHGGIRLGEMERDSLIAHGAAFCLHDRLMHCSDEHKTYVCPSCGSFTSPVMPLRVSEMERHGLKSAALRPVPRCQACKVPCRLVALPFVLRYLCAELAAINVHVKLDLSSRGERITVPPAPESATGHWQMHKGIQPPFKEPHPHLMRHSRAGWMAGVKDEEGEGELGLPSGLERGPVLPTGGARGGVGVKREDVPDKLGVGRVVAGPQRVRQPEINEQEGEFYYYDEYDEYPDQAMVENEMDEYLGDEDAMDEDEREERMGCAE